MLNHALAQEVLNTALATGGDFAELFLEDRRDNTLVLQSNRLETVNSGRIHGAGIRVYVGLNAIYTYTNDTSREGMLRCAKQAASAVKEQKSALSALPFSNVPTSEYKLPVYRIFLSIVQGSGSHPLPAAPLTLRPCLTFPEQRKAAAIHPNGNANLSSASLTIFHLTSHASCHDSFYLFYSFLQFLSQCEHPLFFRFTYFSVISINSVNFIFHIA